MAAGNTVLVVKVTAATTVTRPRCSASANSTVPSRPSTTIAQSDGCKARRQAGSGTSRPRADTATQVNARPAAKASTGADHGPLIRRPMAPSPASGRAIPRSNQCHTGAGGGTSCDVEEKASNTKPTRDDASAIHPGRPSGLPEKATTSAVTATLDATTAWTRNNGNSCNATTVNAKPSRSTVRPARYSGSWTSGGSAPWCRPRRVARLTPNASIADPKPDPTDARMANVSPTSIAEVCQSRSAAGF